jgi:uncharacterized protein (TIGR02466 family)
MINLFPVQIYKGHIEQKDNILYDQVKEFLEGTTKDLWTGESGWSTGEKSLALWEHVNLDSLFQTMMPFVYEYWNSLDYIPANITVQSCWANLHNSNDVTEEHSHCDGFRGANILSGVYYLRKPTEANIRFINPLEYILRMTPYNTMQGIKSISTEVECSEGDFLVWPSWLKHRVEPSEYDGERIAISFNFSGNPQ